MRELQVVVSDDLIFAQTGERVPADETVMLSLDGDVRELDLTSAHAAELRETLADWLTAGHVPEKPERRESAHGTHGRGVKAGSFMESRAKWKKYRDFADDLGLKSEDGKRPIYRTPGWGYYYPYKLRKMYEAHQAEQAARMDPRGDL